MKSLNYTNKPSGWKSSIYGKKENDSHHSSLKPKVIIASFPRSGNTFLRNILLDVFGVYSWNNIDVYNKALKRVRKLEQDKDLNKLSRSGEKKLAKLKQRLESPFLKTHEIPMNILKHCDKDVKIIYLVRDGRDALVSMAHHRKDIIEPGTDFTKNLNEAIMAPMGSYFGGWGKNVEEWTKIADLLIYFENLTTEPEKEIIKLKEFLDLNEPKMENIPTFESQRSGGSHYGRKKKEDLTKEEQEAFNTSFFRKGSIGGWKEEMPADLQGKFWKKYGDVMLKMWYSKDGNLKRNK